MYNIILFPGHCFPVSTTVYFHAPYSYGILVMYIRMTCNHRVYNEYKEKSALFLVFHFHSLVLLIPVNVFLPKFYSTCHSVQLVLKCLSSTSQFDLAFLLCCVSNDWTYH